MLRPRGESTLPPSLSKGLDRFTAIPDNTVLSDIAFRLGAEHRYAEALVLYQVMEQSAPHFPLLHLNMAYCSRGMADLKSAVYYADAAVDEARADHDKMHAAGDALYNQACIRYWAGDKAGAREALM
ncbi:MAG TPA: hypothetical protein VGL72_04865, partial [Bryobacteraceae bacterium]